VREIEVRFRGLGRNQGVEQIIPSSRGLTADEPTIMPAAQRGVGSSGN
jgi:hypothetical protein